MSVEPQRHIIWQYSPEWQRQMGIFAPSSPAAADGKATANAVARGDGDGDVNEPDEADELVEPREASADGFIAAGGKLEAVNRLSRAAGGGEESLGPGSKERKSVLITLAKALGVAESSHELNKHALAGALADALDVDWLPQYQSSGYTITLDGLNALLEGAEKRFTRRAVASSSVLDEAKAIGEVVREVLPATFHIWDACDEMREAEVRGWADSQWQGFYFEHRAIGPLTGRLGGGPVASPGKPVFDYGQTYTWDLKAHTLGKYDWAILNDKEASDWAAAEKGGLGLIVLTGEARFEPGTKAKHDEYKARHGRPRKGAPSDNPRDIKAEFTPRAVHFFFFPTPEAMGDALTAGVLAVYKQGKQQGGASRGPKYQINVAKALNSAWHVLTVDL